MKKIMVTQSILWATAVLMLVFSWGDLKEAEAESVY